MRVAFFALGAVAFIVVGCRTELGVEMRVQTSGAGEIVVSVAGDTDAADEVEAAGFTGLAAVLRGRPTTSVEGEDGAPVVLDDLAAAGWQIRADGGTTRISHSFSTPEQLETLAGDLSPFLNDVHLVHDRGLFQSRFRFDASLDFRRETLEALATDGLETPPTSEELESVLGGALADGFRMRVLVALPGSAQVVKATTDSEEGGGGFVWELRPGESVDLRLTSTVWSVSRLALAVGIAVGLGGAVIAGLFWLRARKPVTGAR